MLYYIMARTIQFLNQNTMKKLKNITKKGMKSQGGMNIYSERANYLFNESKKFAASGQNSIYAYFNTKTKNIKTAAAQEVRLSQSQVTLWERCLYFLGSSRPSFTVLKQLAR